MRAFIAFSSAVRNSVNRIWMSSNSRCTSFDVNSTGNTLPQTVSYTQLNWTVSQNTQAKLIRCLTKRCKIGNHYLMGWCLTLWNSLWTTANTRRTRLPYRPVFLGDVVLVQSIKNAITTDIPVKATIYTVSQKILYQLWSSTAQNYKDRFWWYLAEIFEKTISSPDCKTPVSDKSKTFQEDEKLFIFWYESPKTIYGVNRKA